MEVLSVPVPAQAPSGAPRDDAPAIDVKGVSRRFGAVEALSGVSLTVWPGEVHALLGPNGAGKTTLMRLLSGVADPSAGEARVLGLRAGRSREVRAAVGLVPSGDRTFYLRLSGLENLVFFARLHGLRRRAAVARAQAVLAAVDLEDVGRRPASTYSHGMQKRLSFARALLDHPEVLLVDEATHDLDPVAGRRVLELAAQQAAEGVAVLWATQRLEELVGFAERVTVLEHGRTRFSGSLAALAAHARGARHLLRLGADAPAPSALRAALGALGSLTSGSDGDERHVLLELAPGASLGTAIAALVGAGAEVVSCREERPPIEAAFLTVVKGRAA
jgi:ABC-2 type transport system ATP-binding protein